MAGLTIPYWEVALRLVLTVVLCGAIGFEREVRDQPAGFRTDALNLLQRFFFNTTSTSERVNSWPTLTRV